MRRRGVSAARRGVVVGVALLWLRPRRVADGSGVSSSAPSSAISSRRDAAGTGSGSGSGSATPSLSLSSG